VRPSPWIGAIVVLLGIALRYLALWVGVVSVSWASMVVVVAGLSIGILGTRFLRVLYVPLLYLLLLFPWPSDLYERIALPMQRAAAAGSLFILDVFGILARREGNVIHLYGGSLEVAQACSGLRLLFAFVSVAGAVAFIVDRPRWQRVVILISALPVAVFANMARVVTTAMAAEWFGMEAASGWFHGTAGYGMILLAFGLFWFELWFLGKLVVAEEETEEPEDAPAPPVWIPQPGARPVLVAILLGLPLVATGFLQPMIEKSIDRSAALQPFLPLQRPFEEFPDQLADCAVRDFPLEPDVVKALKADTYLRKILVDGEGRDVGMIFTSYNGIARKFYTHRPTVCMPSAGWAQVGHTTRDTTTLRGRRVPYNEYTFSGVDGRRMMILSYFNASGTRVTRVEALRLHMARPGPGFVSQVIVSVPIPPGRDGGEASRWAGDVIAALTDELEAFLPHVDRSAVEGEANHDPM
jgi:exosortase